MSQADSINTTSRRSFLSVVGGSAAALAAPLPAVSRQVDAKPDPILAAIEGHRMAYEALSAAFNVQDDIENRFFMERGRKPKTGWRFYKKPARIIPP